MKLMPHPVASAVCLIWLLSGFPGFAQSRPYIGFAYPAGGRQGTTFRVVVGGQGLENVHRVHVSGSGVQARLLEYHRRLSPQDVTVLRDQLAELRKAAGKGGQQAVLPPAQAELKKRIEERLANYVNRPACASIANLAVLEVTMAANAAPGERELRLGTPTGLSNPLSFHIGQLPEVAREPMRTCEVQVLGKEELALRKGGDGHTEVRLGLPCTVNGQLGSGEQHRYRFSARAGQHLVITTLARQLIPYIADAVPGWVQPVVRVLDAQGRELAYADDFRFKPDPVILFRAPNTGDYVLTINDNIFRGREDFVYRVSVGELPYVTSLFPLGMRAGDVPTLRLQGANLDQAVMVPPGKFASPGLYPLGGKAGHLVLNRLPFVVDVWPDGLEAEPNNEPTAAGHLKLPFVVNGRIDRRDDWDVFAFRGVAGETVVAEVVARRLDSPLDSVLKITDSTGQVLAFNDDREDPGAGLHTHHADAYVSFKVPQDGEYFVHLGDTGRQGGEEYAYRLRVGPPQPDFALRAVPSSLSIRGQSSATISVHVTREDGFTGPIQITLQNPPAGISSIPVTLSGTQQVARLNIKCAWLPPREPMGVRVEIAGVASIAGQDVVRIAGGAEDRMQAFLWRHLVPTAEFRAEVYAPDYQPPTRRPPPPSVEQVNQARVAVAKTEGNPPKFTKGQVAGRLRMLASLYEEGLLTDDFYRATAAECEAAR